MIAKDERWDLWPYVNEEYFNTLADKLMLRAEIPQNVSSIVNQAKSVLRFCYYDYELIGVTNLLITIAFESALSELYTKIEKREKGVKNRSLRYLIKWARRKNLLEEDLHVYKSLRILRNAYAHQKAAMIMGYPGVIFLRKTIDLINGIYDPNIDLRVERKIEYENINKALSNSFEEGLILHIGTTKLIIFDARLLIYDNLLLNPLYHFSFYPIFEIKENATEVDEKRPILLTSEFIKFQGSGDSWKAIIANAYLTRILEKDNVGKFRFWKNGLNNCNVRVYPVIQHQLGQLRSLLLSKHIYRTTPEDIML